MCGSEAGLGIHKLARFLVHPISPHRHATRPRSCLVCAVPAPHPPYPLTPALLQGMYLALSASLDLFGLVALQASRHPWVR